MKWEYFTAGGKGGQHQNKTASACRCTHEESGANGISRDERSQMLNRRKAFQRLAESDKFQKWLRIEVSRRMRDKDEDRKLEENVNEMMKPENLRIQIKVKGQWVDESSD